MSSFGFKEATLLLQAMFELKGIDSEDHTAYVLRCFSLFFHVFPSHRAATILTEKRTSNDGPSITFAGFFSPTSRALSAASMPLALKIHIKKVPLQIVDLLTGKMRS